MDLLLTDRLERGLRQRGCVIDHLAQNSEVSRLFRDSLGLCLAHLRMALEIPDRDAGLEALLEAEAVWLETLDGELEAYLRKQEARFSGEPYGSEADAFIRATAFLAGGRRMLPGWGAAAVPAGSPMDGRGR